jgi:hypothetical protein
MTETLPKSNSPGGICTVLADRGQFVARTWDKEIPELEGFQTCWDTFVRRQTPIQTYRRVRSLKNSKTKTKVFIQYSRVPPWLEPVKVTVVSGNPEGLQRAELERICEPFRWTRLLTLELAFDFSSDSGIDRAFVLRHGIFGKSRLVRGRPYNSLRFGTHHSPTLVRAYDKPETASYRIEIQLHSPWLRKYRVTSACDLPKLARLLCPARIQFVEIDWNRLALCLRRADPSGVSLNRARKYEPSIHRLLAFLRSEAGLVNVHRFLLPLRINHLIRHKLENWAQQWLESAAKSRGELND